MNRIAAGLIFAATAALAGGEPPPAYTVYLVRHAEKTAEAHDPGLTPAGGERAARLAAWAGERDIEHVYSSDYRRTRDTAAPVADVLGLALELYDPSDLGSFAARLTQQGEAALVVGHSNTTPQLAALLCDCEVPPMDESEYDRLYVVTLDGDRASLEVLSQPSS